MFDPVSNFEFGATKLEMIQNFSCGNFADNLFCESTVQKIINSSLFWRDIVVVLLHFHPDSVGRKKGQVNFPDIEGDQGQNEGERRQNLRNGRPRLRQGQRLPAMAGESG